MKKEKIKSPVTIQIIANYPIERKLNKNGKSIENGTFHVRLVEWDIDVRGIHYAIIKDRVWIFMPSRKGVLNKIPCEFPVLNFVQKEDQRGFVHAIKKAFINFFKTKKFVSIDQQEKEKKMRVKKNMVFLDPPNRNY